MENTAATNKQILLQANKAITRGDQEGFLAFCSEDTDWNFVGGERLRGKGQVRAWMKLNYKEPPRFDVQQLIAEGAYVTAVGTISVASGEGAREDQLYCDVWKFHDGKMIELRAFVIKPSE